MNMNSFYWDWNPKLSGGGTYDLRVPMKEISLLDDVDVLANIDDLSAEILMNDCSSKKHK